MLIEFGNSNVNFGKEYKHNIIKSGSSAPEPVLRKLYEDCFSTGSVYNKNADNLIHNYLNEE